MNSGLNNKRKHIYYFKLDRENRWSNLYAGWRTS